MSNLQRACTNLKISNEHIREFVNLKIALVKDRLTDADVGAMLAGTKELHPGVKQYLELRHVNQDILDNVE